MVELCCIRIFLEKFLNFPHKSRFVRLSINFYIHSNQKNEIESLKAANKIEIYRVSLIHLLFLPSQRIRTMNWKKSLTLKHEMISHEIFVHVWSCRCSMSLIKHKMSRQQQGRCDNKTFPLNGWNKKLWWKRVGNRSRHRQEGCWLKKYKFFTSQRDKLHTLWIFNVYQSLFSVVWCFTSSFRFHIFQSAFASLSFILYIYLYEIKNEQSYDITQKDHLRAFETNNLVLLHNFFFCSISEFVEASQLTTVFVPNNSSYRFH